MTDPAAKVRLRPLLRPWVSLDPDPVLFYADERGQLQALALRPVDLAHLALSIAEAQAVLGRWLIEDPGRDRRAAD